MDDESATQPYTLPQRASEVRMPPGTVMVPIDQTRINGEQLPQTPSHPISTLPSATGGQTMSFPTSLKNTTRGKVFATSAIAVLILTGIVGAISYLVLRQNDQDTLVPTDIDLTAISDTNPLAGDTINNNVTINRNLSVRGSAQIEGVLTVEGEFIEANNLEVTDTVTSGRFVGDGSALTSLNGTNITTGTISQSVLPPTIAYLDNTQTFTGTNTFQGDVVFNNGITANSIITQNGNEVCDDSNNCDFTTADGAPTDGLYLTLALNGTLSNERHFQTGTSLVAIDSGANGDFEIDTIQDIRISASPTFTSLALSADLQILESVGGAFYGTFDVGDLTSNQTYTFPNATGSVCLTSGNCAGIGGTGDILDGGQAGPITIGTNDATTLTLETNNTPALTILSNGNVGIGATNPVAQLEIAAGTNNYARFNFNSINMGTAAYLKSASISLTYDLNINSTEQITFGTPGSPRFVVNILQGNGAGIVVNPQSATQVGQVIRGFASQSSDLLQFQDSNGLINGSFDVLGNQLTLGRIASSGTVTQGKLILSDGTTDNFSATLQAATLTGNKIFNLPNISGASGTICVSGETCASSGILGYWSRSGTTLSPSTGGDSLSVPGAGAGSEKFGLGATAAGANSLAIGNGAAATTSSSIAIGQNATSAAGGGGDIVIGNNASVSPTGLNGAIVIGTSAVGGYRAVTIGAGAAGCRLATTIGFGAICGGDNNTIVGFGATGNASNNATAFGHGASALGNSIAIGLAATNTASNQLVIGSSTAAVSNVFIGEGVTDATPLSTTFNATGGSGVDIAGADLIFASGKATGSAVGGDLLFQTSNAGSSGATLQSLTTKMIITETGNVGIGTTTPASKLEILQASQAATQGLYIGNVSGNLKLYENVGNTSTIETGGSFVFGAPSSVPLGGTLQAGRGLILKSFNDSTLGSVSLVVGSTTALHVDQNANVGIGTTNPSTHKLEVNGAVSTYGPDGAIHIGSRGSGPSYTQGDWSLFSPSGELSFYGGFQTRGTWLPNGNLSVGGIAPTSLFEVNQPTFGYGTVDINGTTTVQGNFLTQFLNTFKVGDSITVNGETRTIATITDNDTLTVTVAFGTTASGQQYTLTGGSRLNVLGNGNVGIGTTTSGSKLDIYNTTSSSDVDLFRLLSDVGGAANVKFRIDSDGDIFTDGSIVIGTPADVAEKYENHDGAQAGDVVVFASPTTVIRSTRVYQKGLAGVVSTNPGLTLSGSTKGVAVALSGRVPVKVSAAHGAIEAGDYLTSGPDGRAVKATQAGPTIGTALEPADQDGTIEVFVHLGHYTPADTDLTQSQGTNPQIGSAVGQFTSLNVSGNATLATLRVTETATFEKDLEVKGTARVVNLVINGHIIGNPDTRGEVIIPAGALRGSYEFEKPFDSKPFVVVSPTNKAVLYWVETTKQGFTIHLTSSEAEEDTTFNYLIQQ